VDLQDLVSGEPAGKVEIVRGGVVEQGAVGIHLAGAGGRGFLIAADGFEDHDLADLARFNASAGGHVGRIVAAHVPDLENDAGLADGGKCDVGIVERQGKGLFAKHVLACCRGGNDGGQMVFGGDAMTTASNPGCAESCSAEQ